MKLHIIEGEAGCRYAVHNGLVAIVVDALRASATTAMLLEAGALDICMVSEVDEVLAARRAMPDALLFGERGGLPPQGFDCGNSPRDVGAALGKRVVFTSTTGSRRLIDSWGAAAIYMGSTVNSRAVMEAAMGHGKDIVLIPAGLSNDPSFDAQEDWVAATVLAQEGGGEVGEGAERFEYWSERIAGEGIDALFQSAPHADKLRAVGLDADISFCARVDIAEAVPFAVERTPSGVRVANASLQEEEMG